MKTAERTRTAASRTNPSVPTHSLGGQVGVVCAAMLRYLGLFPHGGLSALFSTGDASLYGFGAGMKYIGTQQDPDAAIADIPCFSLLAMITKGQHGKVMYVELNLMSPVKFDDVDKVIVATEQDPLPGPDDDEVKAWVAFGRAHAANIDVCKGRSYKFGTAPTCASLYRCDATQDSRCGPADGWSTSPDKPLP